MSELAFTVARLGFLALLWFFVFLVVRALRHDTAAEASAPAAPRRAGRIGKPAATRYRAAQQRGSGEKLD